MLTWDRDFFDVVSTPKALNGGSRRSFPSRNNDCLSRNSNSSTEMSNSSSSQYGSLNCELESDSWSPIEGKLRTNEVWQGCQEVRRTTNEEILADDCWMKGIPEVPLHYRSADESNSTCSSMIEDEVFWSENKDKELQEPIVDVQLEIDALATTLNPLFSDGWADFLFGPMAFIHRSGEPEKLWLEYRGRLSSQYSPKRLKLLSGGEYPILEKGIIPHLRNNLESLQLPETISVSIDEAFNKVLMQRPFSLDFNHPCTDSRLNSLHLAQFMNSAHISPTLASSPTVELSPIPETKKALADPIEPHRSYSFKSVDGSFNPHDSCDFCYGKALRDAIANGKELPGRNAHGPWFGHRLRDKNGHVLCPRMYNIQCYNCGATGKTAHTYSHCPHPRNSLLAESQR